MYFFVASSIGSDVPGSLKPSISIRRAWEIARCHNTESEALARLTELSGELWRIDKLEDGLAARAAGYRAVIAAPIMGRDERPVGMISAHFLSPRQLTEPEKRLLRLYVDQAAEFIQRFNPHSAVQAVTPKGLVLGE